MEVYPLSLCLRLLPTRTKAASMSDLTISCAATVADLRKAVAKEFLMSEAEAGDTKLYFTTFGTRQLIDRDQDAESLDSPDLHFSHKDVIEVEPAEEGPGPDRGAAGGAPLAKGSGGGVPAEAEAEGSLPNGGHLPDVIALPYYGPAAASSSSPVTPPAPASTIGGGAGIAGGYSYGGGVGLGSGAGAGAGASSSSYSLYGGYSSFSAAKDEVLLAPVSSLVGSSSGRAGLGNLGNTCFMNSSLQCLAHTAPLSAYFLDGRYASELNRESPYGQKGELAEAYAALLKQLYVCVRVRVRV